MRWGEKTKGAANPQVRTGSSGKIENRQMGEWDKKSRVLEADIEEDKERKWSLNVTGRVCTGCMRSLWKLLCSS